MDTVLDTESIRDDFPILKQTIHGRPLVYLDNAATTQVPEYVTQAIIDHYHDDNANVHRGIHTLSERSTSKFEAARTTVHKFLHSRYCDEIIFTKGTTDSLNLLARLWEQRIEEHESIVVTAMEHHANFVPWQQLCRRKDCRFLIIPLTKHGDIDLIKLDHFLETEKISLVALTHVSNVTGAVNPLNTIIERVHAAGAKVVIDAAQSVRHENIDVQELDCDFLCFSGHKMVAPTGIGVLYGKQELLERFQPCDFGGAMVDKVSQKSSTFERPPLRFEAGTPNYVGAIALAAAIEYLIGIGLDGIRSHEKKLIRYAEAQLFEIAGLNILAKPKTRSGCLSFTVKHAHPFDIAALMDKLGIALRSGTQCCQPLLHEYYQIQNVTRMSPAFYNTFEDVDRFIEGLERILPIVTAI